MADGGLALGMVEIPVRGAAKCYCRSRPLNAASGAPSMLTSCARRTRFSKKGTYETLASHSHDRVGREQPRRLRLQRFPTARRADQVRLERGAEPVPAARRPGA